MRDVLGNRKRHQRTQRIWQAARRERWRRLGLCQDCGVPVARFVSCPACRAIRAAAALRWWRKKQLALNRGNCAYCIAMPFAVKDDHSVIVHIRLNDAALWRRIRALASLEGVPVGDIVERAFSKVLECEQQLQPPRALAKKRLIR
jgi:hypothetical protein